MALNAYLKLDGIKGESTADRHKDEIDVMSFSWGVTQSGTIGGGGGGAGKASAQDFQFVLIVDKSSPLLYKACATGQHINNATLALERSTKGQTEYLKYEFKDILISSFSPATDTAPVEGPSPHMGPQPHLAQGDFATAGTSIRSRSVKYSVRGADGNWVSFEFDFAESRGE